MVVGGGLAGLTCAYRLKQAGHRADLYEASDRLGGRCWTLRGDFAEGQIAEHGGELIDQGHTQTRQLAQELGLNLDNLLSAEVNGTEPFYYFDGQPYSFAEATDDLKQIWQQLHKDVSAASYPTLYTQSTQRGRELDAMSIADWIQAYVPGGLKSKLGQLLDVAYNIEYGAETNVQSSLNMLYLLGYSGQGQLRIFGPSNEKYHVRGGNDQIPARLADALQGQITTGSELAAIRRNSDGSYRLSFRSGQRARARSRPTASCSPCRSRSCATSTTRKPASRRSRGPRSRSSGWGRTPSCTSSSTGGTGTRSAATARPTRTPATRTPGR